MGNIFLFTVILLTRFCFGIEYGLDHKVRGDCEIKNFQIFSERSSGSNYIQSLLEKNILNFPHTWHFGHKHFPLWFEKPIEFYNCPSHLYNFEGNEHTLFVVIFRNPYDWLQSLNKKPYHASYDLSKFPFSTFIRKPWTLITTNLNGKVKFEPWTSESSQIEDQTPIYIQNERLRSINPLFDMNPRTGQNFKNVMKLRNQKIRTMLQIKNKVENIYFINYETAKSNPKEFIDEITSIYGLTKKKQFDPILNYKGKTKGVVYKPISYKPISLEDLSFINSELNEALENSIGYKLVTDPRDLSEIDD